LEKIYYELPEVRQVWGNFASEAEGSSLGKINEVSLLNTLLIPIEDDMHSKKS
jgi:hypothetical protein